MKQIKSIFWEKGYRNLNGKRIAHSTMSNMIANAKYKGYYVGNKVKVVDMFTKKQKFLPPEEWVMFKNVCPTRTVNYVRNNRISTGHVQTVHYIAAFTL